ncbi:hypothetical protein BKA65DRAFT_132734 [Rhexocercosporidium sp. MPI-PUGE-AT-0058]|nr:hypothetical protein BKA65DRAFT_132734 [Rhexocercosporidium sp. MPI-PUGE-AT-0058]
MRPYAMIISCLSLVLAAMVVGGRGQPDYRFDFLFNEKEVPLNQPIEIWYKPTLSDASRIKDLSIVLLQFTPSKGVNQIDTSNTARWLDVQPDICVYLNSPNECDTLPTVAPFKSPSWPIQSNFQNSTTATFTIKDGISEKLLENFFFCFASKNATGEYCSYYSRLFTIVHSDDNDHLSADGTSTSAAPANTAFVRPSQRGGNGHEKAKRDFKFPQEGEPMQFSQANQVFIELQPSGPIVTTTINPTTTTSLPPSSTIRSDTTVTEPSSTVATVTPTATAQPTISEVESSSKGLSIGAKVGIALGALAFALILLILALLFLRRKHTRRNQPEQVMLTQSMHTDSFSRNLVTEKEDPITSTAATPIDGPQNALPIQRHSALATYEPVPFAPYNGAAATVPRRKPTAATMVSTVSRGVSTTSGTSSSGARSPRSGDGFEQYHDVVPTYGDARHVPQVFVGNSARGMQSPFLSEEGMTPEEVARLEEEERRIDAAIAEAERR